MLVAVSFVVSSYVYNNCEGYEDFGYGYDGWYHWCIIYNNKFAEFFFGEFINFSCYYGYILIIGIVAAIVGFILKISTEKCEITVSNSRVFGKVPHSKEVDIPLNQITGIHTCSFKGVSVTSIGDVSNFHCIENCKEVIKAISYLLANPQSRVDAHATMAQDESSFANEAEKLKRFKELFDEGIISQEEFDRKKAQILNCK